MQLKKKLNYLLLVKVVFLIFLLGFLLFFYQLYSDFNQYRIKKKDPIANVIKSKILKQGNNIFTSNSKFRQLVRFDIFSKGAKSSKLSDSISVNKKTEDFFILGVVKVGRLYVVVQSKKDKKIRLYSEKSNINRDNYVEKIGVHKILIRNGNDIIRTYKVFKYEEVKKISDKDLKKFSNSPSFSRSKKEKKKKGA